MRPLLSLLIAIALPAVLTAAEPAAWRVVSVHDGDTLTALDAANVQRKIRLHGIDTPEIGQAFGTKARERLAAAMEWCLRPMPASNWSGLYRGLSAFSASIIDACSIDNRDVQLRLHGIFFPQRKHPASGAGLVTTRVG